LERPGRSANLEADVVVPAAQAALSGVLGGSLAAWVLHEVAGWDTVRVWIVATALVTAVTWGLLLREHRRLLWELERRWDVDLDGDGHKGEPEPRERLVFMNRERSKEAAGRQRRENEWRSFLRFVKEIPIRGTAMGSWEKVIGRDRYQEYRDALIDYGFADWRHYAHERPVRSQGWDLVTTVDEILESLGQEE